MEPVDPSLAGVYNSQILLALAVWRTTAANSAPMSVADSLGPEKSDDDDDDDE
jgi:hypothetical protein